MILFFHFWKRNHNSRNYARWNVQLFLLSLSLFFCFVFSNEVTGLGLKYVCVALPFCSGCPSSGSSLLCWARSCLHGCAEGDGWFFRAESAKSSLCCVQISARLITSLFLLDVAQFLQLWNLISPWKKIKSHVESAVNVCSLWFEETWKIYRSLIIFPNLQLCLYWGELCFLCLLYNRGKHQRFVPPTDFKC